MEPSGAREGHFESPPALAAFILGLIACALAWFGLNWADGAFDDLPPGVMGPLVGAYFLTVAIPASFFTAVILMFVAIRRASKTGLGWPETWLAIVTTLGALGITVYRAYDIFGWRFL